MPLRSPAPVLAIVLGWVATAANARAGVPACPASLGGYVATVQGNDVIVCPTAVPPPGYSQSTACPFTLGLVRVDVETGTTASILGPCVADPQSSAVGDAGSPCYLDSCVAPGTYEYGYEVNAFAGCTNAACAGPTSGEWAVVATVTGSPSSCAPSQGDGPAPIWTLVDAGIEDGAVRWSGTCTGPLPAPDGGYCAWGWLDGSAEWAPCPPEGGVLCTWYEADGATIPGPCETSDDAGAGGDGAVSPAPAPTARPGTSGAGGAEAGGGDAAGSEAGGDEAGGSEASGGCSTAPGTAAASLAPLAAIALAFAMRAGRRRSAGRG